jgi:AcrR family transcriptional regulator
MIVVTRKERDRLLRRGDILKAAEHVFADKGYHRATVQDIARKAQYATGTVYLYFKDKESLYYSLIDGKIAEMISAVKEKLSGEQDAGKKLEVFVGEVLAYFERNKEFFSIFVSERSRVEWEFEGHERRWKNDEIERLPFLIGIIQAWQQQNLLTDRYEARYLAEILASIITTVLFHCIKEKQSIGGMSGFVLDMFLNGARKR